MVRGFVVKFVNLCQLSYLLELRYVEALCAVCVRYDQYKDAWDTSVEIDVLGEKVRFFHTKQKGVDRVWVDHP